MQKSILALTSLVLLLSASQGSNAQFRNPQWKKLWRARDLPIDIAVGATPQSATFKLPPLPHSRGTILALRLSARLHTSTVAGWGNYLSISINGKPVGSRNRDLKTRLLNRSPLLQVAGISDVPSRVFGGSDASPSMAALFTPDSSQADARIELDRDEGALYILDVDDLLSADTENTIAVNNLAIQSIFGKNMPAGLKMVVEDLEVGELPLDTATVLRKGPRYPKAITRSGPSIDDGTLHITATPGGALQIRVNDDTYLIEGSFSYADTHGAKFNRLAAGNRSEGDAGWSPRAEKVNDKTLKITAQCRDYQLTRTVTSKEGAIRISDELGSRSREDIGTAVRLEVSSVELPRTWRIGGLETDESQPRLSAENPTCYLEQNSSSLGARVDTSALRLQLAAERHGNSIRMSFNHLGLAKAESKTLNYAIFTQPLAQIREPASGFYSFINVVRKDWGVNFTVQGPFDFVDAERINGPGGDAYLTDFIERKGVRLFGLMPWFECNSKADMTRDEYRAIIQKAMKTIHGRLPSAKCLGLFESNLTRYPLQAFENDLPKDLPFGRVGPKSPAGSIPGKYAMPAPQAMAKRLDATPWRDSLERGPAGVPLLDTYFVENYSGKALNLMVYPVVGNYWHNEALSRLKFLLDDVGLDGIYFDQFSYAYDLSDRFTYHTWDGNTVDMDANGEITRRYADLGLLTSEARRQWISDVLKRGKIAVANTNAAVTEEQNLTVFRFIETQGYDPMAGTIPDARMCAKGQLGSPLALGTADAVTAGALFFNRTIVAHLKYGLLYYYYHPVIPTMGDKAGGFGAVSKMFPITPTELGEGYVAGPERVVSTVSRTFDREGATKPRITLYDEKGQVVTGSSPATLEKTQQGWKVTLKLADWKQVAVIE